MLILLKALDGCGGHLGRRVAVVGFGVQFRSSAHSGRLEHLLDVCGDWCEEGDTQGMTAYGTPILVLHEMMFKTFWKTGERH